MGHPAGFTSEVFHWPPSHGEEEAGGRVVQESVRVRNFVVASRLDVGPLPRINKARGYSTRANVRGTVVREEGDARMQK